MHMDVHASYVVRLSNDDKNRHLHRDLLSDYISYILTEWALMCFG